MPAPLPGAAPADSSEAVVPVLEGGGCTFAARCPHASEQCRTAFPPETEAAPGHFVACWNADALPEMR